MKPRRGGTKTLFIPIPMYVLSDGGDATMNSMTRLTIIYIIWKLSIFLIASC